MIDTKSLRRQYDANKIDMDRSQSPKPRNRFMENLTESIKNGHVTSDDFSVRELYEEFVPNGSELVSSFKPSNASGHDVALLEAGGAISSSAFTSITGQLLIQETLKAFENPVFIGDRLVRTVNTRLSGEKIPGVSPLGDGAEEIGQNEPYPIVGVSEESIEIPDTVNRGFITPVSKEDVFFDRTGLIVDRVSKNAEWFGVNKEKRIIDTVIGVDSSYKRNGNPVVATYGDNSGYHDWDNLVASNPLTDWTSVEAAELILSEILDPSTGEPVLMMANTLLVPPALVMTARRIVEATQVVHFDNQVTADNVRTESTNPLSNYTVLSNSFLKARSSSNTTWWHGDFKRAFEYRQNWGITTTTQGASSDQAFHRDIVFSAKVSERGVVAVVEPRAVDKNVA